MLEPDEKYFGVDQGEKVFEHPIWEKARAKYGDRVEVFRGDRKELSNIETGSIDELVALGTFGESEETLDEFNRVLRSGGLLLLGTTPYKVDQKSFQESWIVRLHECGFSDIPEMNINYNYFPKEGLSERPYIVLAFRKS